MNLASHNIKEIKQYYCLNRNYSNQGRYVGYMYVDFALHRTGSIKFGEKYIQGDLYIYKLLQRNIGYPNRDFTI